MPLCLKRKAEQSIMVGDDIEIMVTEVGCNWVKLNVRAPKAVKVHRREVWDKIREEIQDRKEVVDG